MDSVDLQSTMQSFKRNTKAPFFGEYSYNTTDLSELLRLLQVRVKVVEGGANASERDPMLLLEERQRYDADDAEVARDV